MVLAPTFREWWRQFWCGHDVTRIESDGQQLFRRCWICDARTPGISLGKES